VKGYGYIVGLAALAGVFVVLWHKGQLARLARYIEETREELKKCTWPGPDELKGSTVVVMVSVLLLGGFTFGVDLVIQLLVRLITS
jgi:preprotein translocase SecE subunit